MRSRSEPAQALAAKDATGAMTGEGLALVQAFTCRVACGQSDDLGQGPFGERRCYEILGGRVLGERLSGTLLGTGSDWMLTDLDGCMRMDVRARVRTDDGAVIALRWFGLAQPSAAMTRALATAQSTAFGDQSIRTHWVLETGDPRYSWVNRTVFVGQGRVRPADERTLGFEHRVYQVG